MVAEGQAVVYSQYINGCAATKNQYLQSCLVVNTLMIQQVLSQVEWMELMQPEDLRALTPFIWGHVNPYGTFQLDLEERLPIETAA